MEYGNSESFSKKRSESQVTVDLSKRRSKQPSEIRESNRSFKKNYSLLYFNAGSLANKIDILNALLITNYYDFVFICESWLKERHITPSLLKTSSYTIYRSDRKHKRGGGVAIIAKQTFSNNINILPLEIEQDFEILGLDYYSNNRSYTRFICVYLPPANSTDPTIVRNLTRILNNLIPESIHTPLYIIGDFNFSDVNWSYLSSKSHNNSFSIFSEFLSKHDLSQMIRSPTHRHGKILDLLITSTPSKILSLEIREPFGTTCDHNMIEIKINLFTHHIAPLNIRKYNFYKADYNSINTYLDSQQWEFLYNEENTISDTYSKFTGVLQ